MGRNSGGVASMSSSPKRGGDITIRSLGLTPDALRTFGGDRQIGGMVDYFNKKVTEAYNAYKNQLSSMYGLSGNQRKALEEKVSYYRRNRSAGHQEAIGYIKDKVGKVVSGGFKETLLNLDSFTRTHLDFMAKRKAQSMLVPLMEKKLKG